MAEYQENRTPKEESQELENECPTHRLLAHVPSIHGFYPFHGSIAFYLMNNPMSLDELMRKQYHPGYLWYNLDPSFSLLKIVSKEWHQTVTSDLRIKMMYKVCEGIFPRKYIEAYSYTKSHIMAANARVFEGEAYAMANSISEYYYLLDDKIDIIQKRQEQHLAQQQQQLQQEDQKNKNFMANFMATLAVGSSNSKSPDMQSPPNVPVGFSFLQNNFSVSTNVVDQQMVVSLDNVSMKKQLCDEKNSDNLESLDSGKDSDNLESSDSSKDSNNFESPDSGKDSDDLELPDSGKDSGNLESSDSEERVTLVQEYKTITPDLRVPKTKEWHQTVTLRLRMHIIYQILETLFPSYCRRDWFHVGSYNMYAFVRRVEADIYEMANSKSEYYQLVAEKIYRLQNDHKKQQSALPLSACRSNGGSSLMRLKARMHLYRSVQMALFHAQRAEGNAPPPAPAAPPATDAPATETVPAPAVERK